MLILKKNNPYTFFVDLETTGFSPTKNDIIQLAGIIVKENVVVASFNEFCRPSYPETWGAGAEKIHKITLYQAMRFQPQRIMLIKLMKFLAPYRIDSDPIIKFTSHAKGKFDYRFLLDCFIRENLGDSFFRVFSERKYESTITLADNCKKITGLESSKLSELAEYFDLELDHHAAESDVNCCFEVYKRLKEMDKGIFK